MRNQTKEKILVAAWLLSAVNLVLAADHTIRPIGTTTITPRAQLCTPGYSSSVRPSAAYTQRLKRLWVPAGHTTAEYELDHYIPISLGGSPTDPNNLWLQTWKEARRKDVAEYNLYRDMCKGIYSPDKAQIAMREWR